MHQSKRSDKLHFGSPKFIISTHISQHQGNAPAYFSPPPIFQAPPPIREAVLIPQPTESQLRTSQILTFISSQLPDPKNFHHQPYSDRITLYCHSSPISSCETSSKHNCIPQVIHNSCLVRHLLPPPINLPPTPHNLTSTSNFCSTTQQVTPFPKTYQEEIVGTSHLKSTEVQNSERQCQQKRFSIPAEDLISNHRLGKTNRRQSNSETSVGARKDFSPKHANSCHQLLQGFLGQKGLPTTHLGCLSKNQRVLAQSSVKARQHSPKPTRKRSRGLRRTKSIPVADDLNRATDDNSEAFCVCPLQCVNSQERSSISHPFCAAENPKQESLKPHTEIFNNQFWKFPEESESSVAERQRQLSYFPTAAPNENFSCILEGCSASSHLSCCQQKSCREDLNTSVFGYHHSSSDKALPNVPLQTEHVKKSSISSSQGVGHYYNADRKTSSLTSIPSYSGFKIQEVLSSDKIALAELVDSAPNIFPASSLQQQLLSRFEEVNDPKKFLKIAPYSESRSARAAHHKEVVNLFAKNTANGALDSLDYSPNDADSHAFVDPQITKQENFPFKPPFSDSLHLSFSERTSKFSLNALSSNISNLGNDADTKAFLISSEDINSTNGFPSMVDPSALSAIHKGYQNKGPSTTSTTITRTASKAAPRTLSLQNPTLSASKMLCERPPELISPPNVFITEIKKNGHVGKGGSPANANNTQQCMKVRLVEVSFVSCLATYGIACSQ